MAPTTLAAQAIPWLDQPVAKIVIPDPNAPITNAIRYRTCRATDLLMAAKDNGAIMETRYGSITFTNRSTSACTLSGTPTVVIGVTASGRRQSVPITPDGYGFKLDDVANLQPGDQGLLTLSSSGECGIDKPTFFAGFALTLPSGQALTAATPKTYQAFLAGCPYKVSSIGVPHHFKPWPTYPTDPIKATINAPASVVSGTPIDYTVTLTNPTAKAISLAPCPSYEETAFRKPDPHPDDATYQLNCAGHDALEPGESLTFAMHTAGIGPTGQGQIFWQLQESNVFAPSAWLTVT
jgi:hypothetical protein